MDRMDNRMLLEMFPGSKYHLIDPTFLRQVLTFLKCQVHPSRLKPYWETNLWFEWDRVHELRAMSKSSWRMDWIGWVGLFLRCRMRSGNGVS